MMWGCTGYEERVGEWIWLGEMCGGERKGNVDFIDLEWRGEE